MQPGGGKLFCIECGSPMDPGAQACPRCGAPPWDPKQIAATSGAEEIPISLGAAVGTTPWFFGLGAILLLIWSASALAVVVNPVGRAELARGAGGPGVDPAVYGAAVVAIAIAIAGLHAAAFYGLRAGRRWAWITAVVLASLWSLVLIGIPVLIRLLSRRTRRVFGID